MSDLGLVRSSIATLTSLLLLVAVTPSVHAEAVPELYAHTRDTPPDPGIEGAYLIEQAEQYASLFSVGLDEARDQISTQEVAGPFLEKLKSDREIDYYEFEHSPYRIVVGTQNMDSALPAEINGHKVFVEQSRVDRETLWRLADIVQRQISEIKGGYDWEVQERPGSVVVRYANAEVPRSLDRIADEVKALAPATLIVDAVNPENLSHPSVILQAGNTLSSCTAGFTTRDWDGQVLMMTAGHCTPNTQYGGGSSLPFKRQEVKGSEDWQLNYGGSTSLRGRIYNGTISIPMTASYTSGSGVGEFRCKYGKVTGYTCGSVTNNYFNPSAYWQTLDGWTGAPNPAFVRVRGNVDMSTPGDSGGPVFVSNQGFGIVEGWVNDGDGHPDDLIYTSGQYLWANGRAALWANDIRPNETLLPGASRWSFDGRFRLVMQPDGNLVLYKAGAGATWATYTSASNSRAVMQNDGNLVVYSPSGAATWAASWNGLAPASGSEAIVQDDGNFVIYSSTGGPRWATGTS